VSMPIFCGPPRRPKTGMNWRQIRSS